MFDVNEIRKQFPILSRKVNDHDLIYFDNAASTQKPQSVIDEIVEFYSEHNANIHRGIHTLSEESTDMYEAVRLETSRFINAKSQDEIIFTKNTTESNNLVAFSWIRANLKNGDRILISEMEHHSNIVPWQMVTDELGIELKILPLDENFHIDQDIYSQEITDKAVKFVSLVHMSNVLGSINPVSEMTSKAHELNIPVFIDAAQSIPHMPIDVQEINCDFMSFSAHKMCGPTGVGVLYVKRERMEEMVPFLTGGGMIYEVSEIESSFADGPEKFEAGTPNIAGVIGFGAALRFLDKIGMETIFSHEKELTKYMLSELKQISELKLFGSSEIENRGAVFAFMLPNIHPHDVSELLNTKGIAIRSGHHCAQPLHKSFDISSSSRASLYLYNTKDEIDIFISVLKDSISKFA